jgi:oligosaccharide reducing-end xylanase
MADAKYPNRLKDLGCGEGEIKDRVESCFHGMFYGDESQRVYAPVGADMGQVIDTGNNDARTEGMSYGMMAAVQMGDKDLFDRVWRWARKYMYHEEGPFKGYFAWSANLDGSLRSEGPAPDGEEYFALALLFASHRWGDGPAPLDYSVMARRILRDCLHKGRDSEGAPMWNRDNGQILFVPGCPWTDPSYHLPHFYELFALWADPEDRPFWKKAALASRAYLPTSCHPATGLAPEYSEFDGKPHKAEWDYGHHKFYSDSYRVAANIGLCHAWSGPDSALSDIASNIVRFFDAQDPADLRMYELDGTPLEEPALHPTGLLATNAMAALAIERSGPADRAVRRFWEMPPRTGPRRYYDNFLYLFALLALSGNYRVY